MPKLLIALRGAPRPPSWPGLGRWTVEVAQPGQELLVAAGLRYDGRTLYDALVWCWFDGPAPALDRAFDSTGDVVAVWRLDERPGWDRSDAGGEALGSEAVKMVSFVVRRPDVTREKFEQDYGEHVAVARVHHPGVWRYIQNIVTDGMGEGADGVEAISELWYASGEEFLTRFYANDKSPGVVKADNEEYIDFARTRSLILTTSLNGVA